MEGLYRHFKGGYFYVTGVSQLCCEGSMDKIKIATYIDIRHPENGHYSRPIDEFNTVVRGKEGNVTGQIYRFEKINSL